MKYVVRELMITVLALFYCRKLQMLQTHAVLSLLTAVTTSNRRKCPFTIERSA